MAQIVQVAGALAILVAYVLGLFHRLDVRSYAYLVLNLAGSAVLTVLAYHERQWGFLLLEAVWAVVSAYGLVARASGRDARAAGH